MSRTAFKSTATQLLIACAVVVGSAQLAHARWELCNHTSIQLNVTYRAPGDGCTTKYRQDHISMAPGFCKVLYEGSAIGKPLYFYAEAADGSMIWEGNSWYWVPNTREPCAPTISCRPSVGTVCGDGEIFPMVAKTSTSTNKKINLVP